MNALKAYLIFVQGNKLINLSRSVAEQMFNRMQERLLSLRMAFISGRILAILEKIPETFIHETAISTAIPPQ